MSKFLEKIKTIASKNKKVAMFVDMDGTITVYGVYQEADVARKMAEDYKTAEPLNYVINILEEINNIPNVDIYILTLSRDKKITEEKEIWLEKYVNFVKPETWIITTKEIGKYKKVNGEGIKAEKTKAKLETDE